MFINPLISIIAVHLASPIIKGMLFNHPHFVYYLMTAYLIRCRKEDLEFVDQVLAVYKKRSFLRSVIGVCLSYLPAIYLYYTSFMDFEFFSKTSNYLMLVRNRGVEGLIKAALVRLRCLVWI